MNKYYGLQSSMSILAFSTKKWETVHCGERIYMYGIELIFLTGVIWDHSWVRALYM